MTSVLRRLMAQTNGLRPGDWMATLAGGSKLMLGINQETSWDTLLKKMPQLEYLLSIYKIR